MVLVLTYTSKTSIRLLIISTNKPSIAIGCACLDKHILSCEYLWKTFAFAAKQHPQVPKHFEIHGKTFTVQAKTAKTAKVLALKCLY